MVNPPTRLGDAVTASQVHVAQETHHFARLGMIAHAYRHRPKGVLQITRRPVVASRVVKIRMEFPAIWASSRLGQPSSPAAVAST